MHLLVVEDNILLGTNLKKALESAQYKVDLVNDGELALTAIQTTEYSLIVLDINLPKVSGLDVLKKLRAKGLTVPVLVLTARDAQYQKVEGLDAGADDYLVKPFDLDELYARVRALVRRSNKVYSNTITCQDVSLDLRGGAVMKGDELIQVTAKELKVLRKLMLSSDRYISKSDLESSLYNEDGSFESNTVEVSIYNLRKKLGSKFITMSRGIGYMIKK